MSKVIGVFDQRNQAEKAVKALKNAGISEEKISLAAREDMFAGEEEEGNNTSYLNQNLTTGAGTGGALGGLAGLMVGAGALAIPGVGPILAAGPLAAGLTGLAAGGIAGGLVDMGIPQHRGDYYQEEVKRGSILALVETDNQRVEDVASRLRNNGARDVETH